MADTKISALTAASTPLAGTEVLPIVQLGTTVKVSVADLTAGRNTSVAKLTASDDVVLAAGKGIDFSANAGAPGMTSELLDWYEEGTFTPSIQFGGASTGITYSNQTGFYTRIGRQVYIFVRIVLSSKGSATGDATIVGLPYGAASNNFPAAIIDPSADFSLLVAGGAIFGVIGSSTVNLLQQTITGRAALTSANFGNTSDLRFGLTYNT
jgi:hypothetical protein